MLDSVMRTLALDVGTKTIGIAVSDELGITANGVTTVLRKGIVHDLEEVGKIVEQYLPAEILIGVPYNMEGEVAARGKEILKFAAKLSEALALPIKYWDESFSTVNAEKMLIDANVSRKRRKKVIDKMAAVFILEEYLESRRACPRED